MRQLKFLLAKEFRQIFRNRALLPMIFIMPVVQLLIMPLAADYETKNINLTVIDHDHSSESRHLVRDITASGYFRLVSFGEDHQQAMQHIEQDLADLILEIPPHFERGLMRGETPQQLLVLVNAINGTKANLGAAYLNSIIRSFNEGLVLKARPSGSALGQGMGIEVRPSNWFNVYLNYKLFMVPAILCILITMVGAYLCSLNIVKEKEIGTIEQINVTPIQKHIYILGKLIPFWIIGIVVFSVGFFVVSWGIYGIQPLGSIALLYAFLALYLVAVLGLGLLISTYSDTQQQAMSVAFFFIMVFVLMSGLFTSIDAMPQWAQAIAALNPVTYFIEVMRMVVIKGSGFEHVRQHFLIMLGFALFFNSWAVWNYRKAS